MGADVTAKDKKGISALHYASGQGRLEVLQYLWSKGLDLDADDPGRSTLLCSHCQQQPFWHKNDVAPQACQSIAGLEWHDQIASF